MADNPLAGKGEWKVIDGALRGTHVKDEPEFDHLVSDKSYKDFTVRLKYMAVKGNSGLYFRIEEKGFSGVTGFKAKIYRLPSGDQPDYTAQSASRSSSCR